MRTHSRVLPVFLLLMSALAGAAIGQEASSRAAAQQAIQQQVRVEIERLQLRSAQDKPISDPDMAALHSQAGDILKAASAALSSGQVYLSLEKLGSAEDLFQAVRRTVDKADVEKNGLPAYEAEWGKVSLTLTALDKEARERNWDHAPAAVRALSEAAQGRSIPLLAGGRGFATATKPTDGLLYLGEAEGEAAFAKFCASLNLPKKDSAFPLRSLLPELQKLQEKTNAAFQPPRSIDLHSRFIALNSTIKLAEELDASRFYAGALYQYLEAVRHYGMLDAAPVDPAKQAALKDAVAAAGKKLADSGQDDSIAQLFIERAESQMVHADGSVPIPDEWRSAQVVLDQVLPAYYAAQKPASPLQLASGKTIDITLVRWPYT